MKDWFAFINVYLVDFPLATQESFFVFNFSITANYI